MEALKRDSEARTAAWESHISAYIKKYEQKASLLNAEREKVNREFEELEKRKVKLAGKYGDASVDDSDLVEINVGGSIITASRGILTFQKGTMLEALFSGRWENELQRDEVGRIFLDINPVCFQRIINHLYELKFAFEQKIHQHLYKDLEHQHIFNKLMNYFEIDCGPSTELPTTILTNYDYQQTLYSWLAEDGFDNKLQLLYRASRDGWQSSDFHDKCDNQGPTLTIIHTSEGYIFGGFCDTPWWGDNSYKSSPKAFLFSLECDSGLPPTKMPLKSASNSNAVHHNRYSGPAFGGGRDIFIGAYANENFNSYTNVGITYECPPGQNGSSFLTGNKNFQAREIEVFGFASSYLGALSTKNRQVDEIPEAIPDENNWEGVTFDELPPIIKESMFQEQLSLKNAKLELRKVKSCLEKEQDFIQHFTAECPNYIVSFDVRGTLLTVKRSALRTFKGSVLERQFDDAIWPEQQMTLSSIKNWSQEQIFEWAQDHDEISTEIANLFRENELNGAQLLALGREDLKDLGVSKPGKLALVMKAISDLKKKSESHPIFIDHNPYCFEKIIDQLRLHEMSPEEYKPLLLSKDQQVEQHTFLETVDYYFPGELAQQIWRSPTIDSSFLDDEQASNIHRWLYEEGYSMEMKLLYRASRDGWKASSFHDRCDNEGPTITVIHTTGGFIFGGFCDTSWSSVECQMVSPKAFLFTIKCCSNLPPTKMRLKSVSSSNAVLHRRCLGPTFGSENNTDICVTDMGNLNTRCSTDVGNTYECPPGKTGNTFLTGGPRFQAREVEVFSVQ